MYSFKICVIFQQFFTFILKFTLAYFKGFGMQIWKVFDNFSIWSMNKNVVTYGESYFQNASR